MSRMSVRGASMRRQRGVTVLVVLMLLTVLLLGAFALARMTESGALIAGNVAVKERAVHASEIGINTAYRQVQALADENASVAPWYFATMQVQTAEGLPQGVDWDALPEISVGEAGSYRLKVRYVIERMCSVAPSTDPLRECLVKQGDSLQTAKAGAEPIEPPTSRQFRITVRVTDEQTPGAATARTFIQALVTRG